MRHAIRGAMPYSMSRTARGVLLVSSNWMQRELLRLLLEDRGYSVRMARDDVDALELIESARDRIIVVLDLSATEKAGFEVLRAATRDPAQCFGHAYVVLLRADYLPLLDAIGAESRQCVTAFDNLPASDKPQAMAGCRPLEVTAQTDSQTLLSQLQAADTPARWNAADQQLKTWARGEVTFYTDRIQAIDANDVTQFKALGDQGTNDQSECAAIEQINADLPVDSQLPPQAGGFCGT